MNIKLSFITPTDFRNINFIREAGESIKLQNLGDTNHAIEWVIVSSQDNPKLDLGKEYKFIKTEKRFAGERRNVGLQEAQGEYIVFLDDDDKYYPDFVKFMIAEIESNNYNAVSCFSKLIFSKEDNSILESSTSHSWPDAIVEYPAYLHNPHSWVLLNEILFKKDKLLGIGGFDESMEASEDYDLILKYIREYGAIKIKSSILSYKREHSGQATRSSEFNGERTVKGMRKIMQKHYDKLNHACSKCDKQYGINDFDNFTFFWLNGTWRFQCC